MQRGDGVDLERVRAVRAKGAPGRSERMTAVASAVSADGWKEPPGWLPPTFYSLAYRNYLLLIIAQISNSLGQWMDMVARPILVIALTGSAVHLGLVTLVRGVPTMALAPVAGILADRVDRRLLLLVSKGLSGVANAAFAVLILTGTLELWHIYATAIIKSVVGAFDSPARHALLPTLVPPRLLANALALNTGSMQVVRIFSSSLAGLLIAGWALAFGFGEHDVRVFGGVYLGIVISFAVAVAATYLLRVPDSGRVERTEDSWLTSFVTGLRFASRNPIIVGVLILWGVQSAFAAPYLQVFVPWIALQVMDIGPVGLGLIMSVSGVGAFLGAVAVATFGHKLRRRGVLVLGGLFLHGLALAMLGLTSILPLVVVLSLALPLLPLLMIIVAGFSHACIAPLKNVLLIEATPNELRGRVTSLLGLDRGFTTVGSGAGGFAIALMGGPYALALFGGLTTLAALLVGAVLPSFRKAD